MQTPYQSTSYDQYTFSQADIRYHNEPDPTDLLMLECLKCDYHFTDEDIENDNVEYDYDYQDGFWSIMHKKCKRPY